MNINEPQFDLNLIEEVTASTVLLVMNDRNNNPIGMGSGFFVLPNVIATNHHVIEGAASGTVNLVGMPTKYTIDGVFAIDKENDLALLKVSASSDIKPLTLISDSETVRRGEGVFVVGNPKGLEGTLSVGIISNLHPLGNNKRLQMTAPISQGSSGGPVLNRKGEVIGIAVGSNQALGAQNLNFAIPSNYLKELLDQLESATPLSEQEQSISAETYYLWGNVKFKQGDRVGAIADYDKAIHLKPDYAEAYNNRGLAKHELGEHTAALEDFDKAIQLKPKLSVAYSNRGLAKAALGELHAAVANYDIALQLRDDDAVVYHSRGVAKGNLEEHAAALEDFNKAIELKPNYAEVYNSRGYVKDKLEEYTDALADYDIAIELKPDYADAYNNRGFVKYELGELSAALEDYETAIQLKPNFPTVYNNRGLVKTNFNQHAAAITDYNIAIQLKPDYADAHFNRGVAYLYLGLRQEAIQDFLIAFRLASQTGNTELKTHIEQFLRDFM